MSVRQYIGARYVTKIYKNSLDPSSAEWEASINYEPLTMVTYNYGSYLSRKDVPASIGNPADNPAYWAQTGFYNGQISNLQNQINAINTELNKQKRKLIVIGDSFSYGSIDPNTLGRGWIAQLTEDYYPEADILYLTEVQAEQVVGVSGFASSKTFLSMLQQIEYFNPDLDKDDITDIVVIGGTNDTPYSQGTIEAAINTFCQYCKTNYKNALIRIGIFGVAVQNTVNVVTAYQNCRYFGAHFMNDLWGVVSTTAYLSDGSHITQQGYDTYCPIIADAIMNEEVEYTCLTSVNITPLVTGDISTYQMDIITTGNCVAIDFKNPIMPANTNTGTITTTLIGNLKTIALGNAAIEVEILGYNGTEWVPAGHGQGWLVNDNTLKIDCYPLAPLPTLTDFRYVFKNAVLQKRIWHTIT